MINTYSKASKFKWAKFNLQKVYKISLQKRIMANGIDRPLDLLNNSKGKEVLVQLKGDKQFVGTLVAFDIHINLVLDNTKEMQGGEMKKSLGLTFLRGDTIIFVSPASTALKEE